MPKVTLLADEFSEHMFIFGRRSFSFKGGQPVEVPVAVALALKPKTKKLGKSKKRAPLFLIEELPEIVEPKGTDSKKIDVVVQQNVDENSRQLSIM